MYINYKGTHFATPVEANAWLEEMKKAGKYADVKIAISNRIVGRVNDKFGRKDYFVKYNPLVRTVVEDRNISVEEHDNNPEYDHSVFTIASYIVKNIGEIDHYREVKLRYEDGKPAGFEHIVLKNGYVIDVTKDRRISCEDGSIMDKNHPNCLISCHVDGQDNADLIVHYSMNGKFIRTASGNIVDYTNDGIYSYRKATEDIIDTSKF